jgi:hypothetical protein
MLYKTISSHERTHHMPSSIITDLQKELLNKAASAPKDEAVEVTAWQRTYMTSVK